MSLLSTSTVENVHAALLSVSVSGDMSEEELHRVDMLVQDAHKGATEDPERWCDTLELSTIVHMEVKEALIREKVQKAMSEPYRSSVVNEKTIRDLDDESLKRTYREATIALVDRLKAREQSYATTEG